MNSTRFYNSLLIALTLLGATGLASADDSFQVKPSASQSAAMVTAIQSGASDTIDLDKPIRISHGAPLACLTRLKDFPYGVNFTLVGTRNDGTDANYSQGSFARSEFLTLAQFDSVHNDWLFASRNTCEEPTGGPGQFPGCNLMQPFTKRSPSDLEVSLREDGQVTLADGGSWSSDFQGACMGDMLYGYNGVDMWIFSFSTGPKPPG